MSKHLTLQKNAGPEKMSWSWS